MIAEQRLSAFLAHGQLMAQLASASGAVQHRSRDAVIDAMAAAVFGVVRASLMCGLALTIPFWGRLAAALVMA